MADLKIFVNAQDGNTVSKFAVWDNAKVQFVNQSTTADLTVSTQRDAQFGAPLCQGNNPVDTFTVPAGSQQSHKICSGYQAPTFKYTATIAGNAPEDPIIIIEKSTIISPLQPGSSFAIGVAVGIVAAFLILKLRSRQRPT